MVRFDNSPIHLVSAQVKIRSTSSPASLNSWAVARALLTRPRLFVRLRVHQNDDCCFQHDNPFSRNSYAPALVVLEPRLLATRVIPTSLCFFISVLASPVITLP